MDNSRIVFLINDAVRAIRATYEDGRAGEPEMFKTFLGNLAVGDLVTVQSGTRHGMTVVKVTVVNCDVDFDSAMPIKWVTGKIDTKAFDKVLEQEAAAISAVQAAELRRKKDELRRSMFKDHEASIASLALTNHADIAPDPFAPSRPYNPEMVTPPWCPFGPDDVI